MKVKIHINTEYKKTAPKISIGCKSKKQEYTLTKKENIIECDFDIHNSDTLQVYFLNKDDQDNNVIEIKKLYIDDIDLQHFIYEGEFTPIYNKNWYDLQKTKPPSIYKPGTEMRHNGVWSLPITLPIWKMMMDNWITDDKRTT